MLPAVDRVLLPGFFSPFAPDRVFDNQDLPPWSLRLVDARGTLHLRPLVHGRTQEFDHDTWQRVRTRASRISDASGSSSAATATGCWAFGGTSTSSGSRGTTACSSSGPTIPLWMALAASIPRSWGP